jgi:hypothetical protein
MVERLQRWIVRWTAGISLGVMMTWLVMGQRAEALVFADSGDPVFNSAAPTGVYADSGWQYMGYFGSFLGTAIGSQYFITAQHIGVQGTTFLQSALFTGVPEVIYTVDTAANGGLGYWDVAGSDLRIFKIEESFAAYAELYTGNAVGQVAVLTGRGGVRGDAVLGGSGETRGWLHTAADGVARWGTNEITGTVGSGAGSYWVAGFDDEERTDFEAGLSVGDSGAGMFVMDGGQWKLAGINSSIDGLFDVNSVVGDGSEFSASLFDRGGFYQGSDAGGWNLVADRPADVPSRIYMSSVTANVGTIAGIIAVPEPGAGALVVMVLWGVALRRRRC